MLEINAKIRPDVGKHNVSLRKQGQVPAILYGHKIDNIHLLINAKDFVKIYQEAGESTLIKLKIDSSEMKGEKERMVLIHDVDKDPVKDNFIHIDFYQPRLDEIISAEVPLEFEGKSLAVADFGGVLIKTFHQIEVKALPKDLPREIKVDISSLNTFEDAIHIRDLNLPEGVKTDLNPDDVVVNVIPPRTEQEMDSLKEKPAEPVAEVKTEAEEKREIKAEEAPEPEEK